MLFEHGTTDDRLTIERLDADRFRALEDAFLILAQRLRQKGIHLIVVGYPDKSMLYPERLPAQRRRSRAEGTTTHCGSFWRGNPR